MTCSNFSLKRTQSYWDWLAAPGLYILLAIAIGGDWCGIRIESGYHSLDCPYQTLHIPATGSAGRNCGGLRGTELISHSGTPGQQPREPVGSTRNKPAVGPASTRARNRTVATAARLGLHPQSINSRPIAAFFTPVNHFISFPDDFNQFNCR